MKLLTDELLRALEAQDPYHPSGPGRELEDHEYMVIAKYFTPMANWTWYCVSASQDPRTQDVQFFGLVDGLEKEFGYFWLSELEGAQACGVLIERDLYWQPITLRKLKEDLGLV